jgi:hypothetical protein
MAGQPEMGDGFTLWNGLFVRQARAGVILPVKVRSG